MSQAEGGTEARTNASTSFSFTVWIIVPVHGRGKDHRLHHRGQVLCEPTQIKKNTSLSPFTLRKH